MFKASESVLTKPNVFLHKNSRNSASSRSSDFLKVN